MIKLFSLKQEKEAEAAQSAAGEKKVAPGLLRMQKGACAGHDSCCTSELLAATPASERSRGTPAPTSRPLALPSGADLSSFCAATHCALPGLRGRCERAQV